MGGGAGVEDYEVSVCSASGWVAVAKQELSTQSVLFVICVCSRRELDGGRVCWVCIGGLDVVVPADEGEGYIRFCFVVLVCLV